MVNEDPYAHVSKGKLRLKSDGSIKKRKKSKHKKLEELGKSIQQEQTDSKTALTRTNAELAFQKMQEKMVCLDIH